MTMSLYCVWDRKPSHTYLGSNRPTYYTESFVLSPKRKLDKRRPINHHRKEEVATYVLIPLWSLCGYSYDFR